MGIDNKNIFYNHKLEEYKKKYGKRGLRKYTKKEVEDFDKEYKTDIKNFLLNNRSWWLIGDTYYQIPKSPIRWFKNLSTLGKVTCSILAAGVVATAVAVPTTLAIKAAIENRTYDPKVDFSTSSGFDMSFEGIEKDCYVYKVSAKKESAEEAEYYIDRVKVGSHTLEIDEEYYVLYPDNNGYESLKVAIKEEVFTKYNGPVKIVVKYYEQGPSIVFSCDKIIVSEGATTGFGAYLDNEEEYAITFKSEDETIATVEDNGDNTATVTGVREGRTYVYAHCAEYDVSNTLEITVTAIGNDNLEVSWTSVAVAEVAKK